MKSRIASMVLGLLLALLGRVGLEATPELHAALHGVAEALAGLALLLAPLVWREVRARWGRL